MAPPRPWRSPRRGRNSSARSCCPTQSSASPRAGTLEQTVAELYPDASNALRAWTIETWERMAPGVVDELDPDWMRFADRVTCPVAIVHGELELGGGGDLASDWFDEPCVRQIDGA